MSDHADLSALQVITGLKMSCFQLEVLTCLLMDQISLTVLSLLSTCLISKLICGGSCQCAVNELNFKHGSKLNSEMSSSLDLQGTKLQRGVLVLAVTQPHSNLPVLKLVLPLILLFFWVQSDPWLSLSMMSFHFSLSSHFQCIICFSQVCSVSDLCILLDKISASLFFFS